jgi:preprotein translocase subunit SecA
MEGRRYSDGLHQAIEAKEGVPIENENQTLASITFQNYFRLYERLSGMTGTAMTEAAEFSEIYNLDVVEIPTNVAVSRIDHDDEIYRTAKEKLDAIVLQIEECHKRHQPVLVGTVSIAKSEELSAILKKKKIKHEVLNARHHAREAAIISDAGKPNAVTIATNMAGRGTDIQLGGNLENMLHGIDDPKKQDGIRAQHAKDKQAVQDAGGLFVIGSERHESRRIDNQLRGRSGRQGDKGSSKFFISLQDDLMRIFGSERIDSMLQTLGLEEGEAIIHPWLNKAMERAQKKVEARNFDIRKNLLKYDDVMNEQRKIIYEQRLDIMQSESVTDVVDDMRHEVVESLITTYMPPKSYPEEWDMAALSEDVKRIFGLTLPFAEWAAEEGVANEEIQQRLQAAVDAQIKDVRETNGVDLMRFAEKSILLQLLDQHWKDHLHTLDHLRQGINLRAYGQRDPLNEYKREAFDLFALMLEKVREMVTTTLARLRIQATSIADVQTPRTADIPMLAVHEDPNTVSPLGHDDTSGDSSQRVTRSTQPIDPNDPSTWGRVMRNQPCPCGSGKKYKYCHGLLE